MKVRYTRPAARQLAELVAALLAVNPFAVKKFAKSLARSLRRWSSFPRSGPRVPEFPSETIRQFCRYATPTSLGAALARLATGGADRVF